MSAGYLTPSAKRVLAFAEAHPGESITTARLRSELGLSLRSVRYALAALRNSPTTYARPVQHWTRSGRVSHWSIGEAALNVDLGMVHTVTNGDLGMVQVDGVPTEPSCTMPRSVRTDDTMAPTSAKHAFGRGFEAARRAAAQKNNTPHLNTSMDVQVSVGSERVSSRRPRLGSGLLRDERSGTAFRTLADLDLMEEIPELATVDIVAEFLAGLQQRGHFFPDKYIVDVRLLVFAIAERHDQDTARAALTHVLRSARAPWAVTVIERFAWDCADGGLGLLPRSAEALERSTPRAAVRAVDGRIGLGAPSGPSRVVRQPQEATAADVARMLVEVLACAA